MVLLTELSYLVDVVLLLPQRLDLLLQRPQLGGGALVVLTERHRLLQLVLQPVRVYPSTHTHTNLLVHHHHHHSDPQ